MSRVAFRADVEGLRAVAIVAVLLFHSGFSRTFSGGFVGVDVFFVISGFLITGNILALESAGHFSYKDFYHRRVRRLFPALLVTALATLAIGLVWATPVELKALGRSAIAVIFSASNFYFWSQAGYFDTGAIQKPLLHTWSLAVEEQFYLVWPALTMLLVTRVRNRRTILILLTVLLIGSFAAAEWTRVSDASTAFYLAPYRVGEFALGAICAWLPPRWMRRPLELDLIALVALVLIIGPVFRYSERTPFPGLTALIPCVGTALLIYFDNSRIARLLLTNLVAVTTGRLSYSLYLVHWPVYVYLTQWRDELSAAWSIAGAVISVAAAVLMYRYVEQPFRLQTGRTARIMPGRFFVTFGSVTASAVAVAIAISMGGGWPWRFGHDLAAIARDAAAEKNERFRLYQEQCLRPDSIRCDAPAAGANVFILGDSHAPDAFNALTTAYPALQYVIHTVPGCPPLAPEDYTLLTDQFPEREACKAMNDKVLHGSHLSRASLIVINVLFGWYQPQHLARALDLIRAQTNADIMVFGNYLVFGDLSPDLPELVLRHRNLKMDGYYEQRASELSFVFEDELQALSHHAHFIFASKRKLLCDGPAINDCPLVFDGRLFTYDRHHLSLAAAVALGRAVKREYDSHFRALGATAPATH